MGKFRTCSISIRENKQVFRAGELVNGYLMLDVLEPVTVKGIRIYCHGKALTKWPKAFSRDLWNKDQIGSETYYAQVITVFGKKCENAIYNFLSFLEEAELMSGGGGGGAHASVQIAFH